MSKLVAALLACLIALPAHAVECGPGDDVCELAVAVVRLDADLGIERAKTTRLTRELTACRDTQAACPPAPAPTPYPWGVVVTTGAVGVALGVVLGVVLRSR